jgi:BCD family chlorophyll transporter-like MFS transporter
MATVIQKTLSVLGLILKALRLALPKIGIGWMFALLSSNFNRITIYELGVTAVLVTVMLGMHNFLSPFQVVFGRIADRNPVFGLRRTPYAFGGALIACMVFPLLPSIAQGMGAGNPIASIGGLGLMLLFGVSLAVMGDSHHSLIAESTDERTRGGIISVVWTFTILSAIVSAGVSKMIMPEYTPESMQQLYNLTPMVVMGSLLLGLVGMERRLKGEELTAAVAKAREAVAPGNALRAAYELLRDNSQVRAFFVFVAASILAIFLQDSILEVFGAEVFQMSVKETASFTQIWGGGVLLGMLVIGIISSIFPINKKTIAMIGSAGTALGLGLLTLCALTGQQAMLNPALLVMGLFTGLFNVGALSLMMEMTVEGATGLYMGMWGTAQAFGNGLSSILSGGLKTLLIESGFLSAQYGYAVIFGIETVLMIVGVATLATVSVAQFRGFTRGDLKRAMEACAVA